MTHLFYSSRIHRISSMKKIGALPISKSLRRSIKRLYLSKFFWKRILTEAGQLKFLGNELIYPDFRHLSYIFSEIFINGIYTFKVDQDKPLILDVGANIGVATIFFKLLYPLSEIIAIEASPKTFDILSKNLEAYSNITTYNNAASDQLGKISFYSDANRVGSGQNSTIPNESLLVEKTEVKTILLSRLITKKVALLKIDIEGGELAVFRDLKKHNSLRYVDKIIMEYHHQQCGVEGLSFILSTLDESGFHYSFGDCSTPAWDGPLKTMMIYAQK